MLQEIGGNKTKAGKLREIKEKYFHKGITFLKICDDNILF